MLRKLSDGKVSLYLHFVDFPLNSTRCTLHEVFGAVTLRTTLRADCSINWVGKGSCYVL